MDHLLGTNSDLIQIHLHNPPHAYSPGDTLLGTIILTPKQPLSISELRIQFQAGLQCFVYRKLFLYALWSGGGWLFRKYLILIDGETTLPPGEYRYPFAVQIPYTTESTKLSALRKWALNFPSRPPFPGFSDEPHALPPSMSTATKHFLGYQNGSVVYALNVSTKKGKDAGFFSSNAINAREIPVVTPRRNLNVDTSQMMYTQPHDGLVTLYLYAPREVQQGGVLPLFMSAEGAPSVRLTALTVKLTAKSKIRGKHILVGRKTATSKDVWTLTSWKGQSVPLGPTQTNTAPQAAAVATVPGNVPVRFASFTLACTGHSLDVEYTVMVGGMGEERKVKGRFGGVPVEVVGWKVQGMGAQEVKGWWNGVVLDKGQYDEHQVRMGRK